MEDFFFVLLILFAVFGPWVFLIFLYVRTRTLRTEIADLRLAVQRGGSDAGTPVTSPETPAVSTPLETEQPGPAAEVAAPETGDEEVYRAETSQSEKVTEEEVEAELEQSDTPPEPARRPWEVDEAPGAVPAPAARGFEETLASQWIVWLGAIALGFAGIFLTAYAIEEGWLGPAARITAGILFGLALTFAGEWVRRRPFQQAIANVRPDYVPQALTAAGIFTLYATIYVGNELYDLYPPLVAFMALALVGLGAVALSLLQGRFVALIGLIGSFIVPVLVSTGSNSAWNLFPYLSAVLAASMAVVRYRAWWGLGYAGLAFATVWFLLWLPFDYQTSDALILGAYVLAVGVIFQLVRTGYPETDRPIDSLFDFVDLHPAEKLGWAGFYATAIMLFGLVRSSNHRLIERGAQGDLVGFRVSGYGAIEMGALAVFALGCLWLARRKIVFDAVFSLAAVLTVLLFASWHLVSLGIGGGWMVPDPYLAPELQLFSISGIIFSALFGFGGFAALWGVRRVALFAGPSAIVPVLIFAIAYWQFVRFGQDMGWAVIALGLAALALVAAGAVAKYQDREQLRVALGLYAAAVVAFLSLGLTMMLEQAWLTVALSLQLPALAWIHQRLKVNLLQVIAGIVAAIVLARLALNHNVFDYGIREGSLFSWTLYGYAIPCAAFFWAKRRFAQDAADDLLIALLEAGTLLFAVLLLSFQIRLAVTGSLDGDYNTLLEQSLQSIVWLAVGTSLLMYGPRLFVGKIPVLKVGTYFLLILAAAQIALVQVGWNNPFTHPQEPVGTAPIFNVLLLAYFIPGCFAFALVRAFRVRGQDLLARFIGYAGLFLTLFFITLEVKHWFQGDTLNARFMSDGENYTVSLAWLIYALVLLAAGIYFRKIGLRYASLAVLLITVAKVFLGDMAGLEGLFRVASFLGLGLSLVGIGYVYQRFVFADTKKAAAGETPPE